MGRKTYLSLSIKPLPGRTNIVVTRDTNFTAPGVLVAPSLEAALEAGRGDALRRGGAEIMVIGGAEIYAQAMPRATPAGDHADPRAPGGRYALPGDRQRLGRKSPGRAHPAGPDDDAAYDFVELSADKRRKIRRVNANSATLGRTALPR